MDAVARLVLEALGPELCTMIKSEVARALEARVSADHQKFLYGVREAAELLSIGESSLWRHIKDGRLNVVLIPGRVAGATEMRIRGADLDAFVLGLASAGGTSLKAPRQAGAGRTKPRRPRSPDRPPRLTDLVQQRIQSGARSKELPGVIPHAGVAREAPDHDRGAT